MTPTDTIFAPATAPGRAGIAVVRLSGPAAHAAAERLAGPLPPEGRALRTLRHDGGPIDQALVLTFRAPRSFTGEDVAELHCHGSPAVVAALLRALAAQGLRMAGAGEFTRRALENGRLDLAEVEGLAALIDAETEGQRRQALRVFSGALGRLAEGWRARLLRAAALAEATIDFADEEIPEGLWGEVRDLCVSLAGEMRQEAAGARLAERLREGFEVAIVGAPNAGKSTLLNRLAGREAAITSEVAGTTRDVIEVRMDLAGLPVTLLDTAGLREAEGVEAIGVARGRARAEAADLRVHLWLPGEPEPAAGPSDIVRRAKADLRGDRAGDGPATGISGLTGAGVDALVEEVAARLAARTAALGAGLRERHARAMLDAAAALEESVALIGAGAELSAESIRAALRAVDALVGRVGTEDVLGEIFASFCIGK